MFGKGFYFVSYARALGADHRCLLGRAHFGLGCDAMGRVAVRLSRKVRG